VRRCTKDISVLFDGDAAGIKAAIRGIDMVLKEGLNVRVVLLPEGEDPDSYSKKLGSTAFRQYLKEQEQDFISFKISLLRSEAANDPIRRAEAIKETVTSIARSEERRVGKECSSRLSRVRRDKATRHEV